MWDENVIRMRKLVLMFFLAVTLAAEQRVNFQKIAFRPTRAEQLATKKRNLIQKVAQFYHRKLAGARNNGKRNLLGMSPDAPEDTFDQPLVPTGVSLLPGDLALRVLNSYHDLQCNYSLDPNLIDDIIQSLSAYELRLTKIQDGSAYKPTSSGEWVDPNQSGDVYATPVVQNQGRLVRRNLRATVVSAPAQPQSRANTFFRYSSFQGSAFHYPFSRGLNDEEYPSGEGKTVKYARCVPEAMPDSLQLSKATKATLVAYKTDFNELKGQYTNLFVPLKLESGINAQGPSGGDDMKELITMASNIMIAHKELEDQITALGTKADDFKLTKAEALTMWGISTDYNQAKLRADVNSPTFAEKDANLANICTTFQTTFETIDSDLEALLALNDDLQVAARDLANVDQTNVTQMQAASVAVPKLNQIANQIMASLAKIEQGLNNTDILEKEANESLRALQGLATSEAGLQQKTTNSSFLRGASAVLAIALASLL